MGIISKFIGSKSKYDKSLPYTYLAKVPIIEGEEDLVSHYFADTICGLVEYLDEQKIAPEEVELYGLYLKNKIKLEKNICTIVKIIGYYDQKFVIPLKNTLIERRMICTRDIKNLKNVHLLIEIGRVKDPKIT